MAAARPAKRKADAAECNAGADPGIALVAQTLVKEGKERMSPRMKPLGSPDHEVRRLGEALFTAVQGAQGRGFISDGIAEIEDRSQFFSIVRNHLDHSERAVKIIRQFLKRHGEHRGGQ